MEQKKTKTQTTEEKETAMLYKGIRERLLLARRKSGMSGERLANAMGENTRQQTISAWETGTQNISLLNLVRLAKALRVSIDWLLSGEGQMEEIPTVRDCAKMLFHDLPTHLDCSWSINAPDTPYGEYAASTPPTLTYRLIIPCELLHDSETEYLTGYVRVKNEYQSFAACATDAQYLEDIRKNHPQLFHKDDYARMLAAIPNEPLRYNYAPLPSFL